jgi:hypothetical protein
VILVKKEENPGEDRIEKLVNSLELVTARMLEMTVINSQLASSQTPQMRGLFDTWIKYMSDEVENFFGSGRNVALEEIAQATGLSRESVLALLMALDKRGKIAITHMTAVPGDGRNRDICDCLL